MVDKIKYRGMNITVKDLINHIRYLINSANTEDKNIVKIDREFEIQRKGALYGTAGFLTCSTISILSSRYLVSPIPPVYSPLVGPDGQKFCAFMEKYFSKSFKGNIRSHSNAGALKELAIYKIFRSGLSHSFLLSTRSNERIFTNTQGVFMSGQFYRKFHYSNKENKIFINLPKFFKEVEKVFYRVS